MQKGKGQGAECSLHGSSKVAIRALFFTLSMMGATTGL